MTAVRYALAFAIVLGSGWGIAGADQPVVHVDVMNAEKLAGQGEYKAAVDVLDRYLANHPGDSRALADRGDDNEALGNQHAAIADYTAAIALNPDFAYAYASRCQSRWEIDLNRDALDDCSKAIALDPGPRLMQYAVRQRALVELDLGDIPAATRDANHALAIDPSQPYSLATRCHVYVSAGRYDDAIKDCNAAIALDDRRASPHFYRGRAEIATQKWTAAIDDFSKVIESDPSEFGAYYWRAMARANAGVYDAGLKDVDKYLDAHGDDADGYLLRAQIELGLGNREEARSSATDALRHYRIDNDVAGAMKAQTFLDRLNGAGSSSH